MKRIVITLAMLAATPAHAAWDRLLGVDADGKHAYVVHDEDPWYVDTYDVASGKVIATWKATGDDARLRPSGGPEIRFLPVDGTLEHDLVKWASMVARTGTGSVRGYLLNGLPCGAGYIYEDGERIVLTGSDGKRTADLAPGEMPRCSPDGTRLFWTTADPMALHASAVRAGAKAADARGFFDNAQWSIDGRSIVAVRIDVTSDERCVVRLAPDTLARTTLACDAWGFAQDPSGKTLAILDREGNVAWIDAATGKRRGSASLDVGRPRGAEEQVVSPDGLYAVLSGDSSEILVADLAHGTTAKVTAPDGHYFEGVRATRWLGGSIVVVETDLSHVTLRKIDVRDALKQAAP